MSMNTEQENFEQLRRLLAIKRHEQPPPGYFDNFSRQVIVRIKAGDRKGETMLERLFEQAPWLESLWTAFETKPVLAGSVGFAICVLLVSGFVYAEKTDMPVATLQPQSDTLEMASLPALMVDPSTTGIIPQDQNGSLFQAAGQFQVKAQPVSFTPIRSD